MRFLTVLLLLLALWAPAAAIPQPVQMPPPPDQYGEEVPPPLVVKRGIRFYPLALWSKAGHRWDYDAGTGLIYLNGMRYDMPHVVYKGCVYVPGKPTDTLDDLQGREYIRNYLTMLEKKEAHKPEITRKNPALRDSYELGEEEDYAPAQPLPPGAVVLDNTSEAQLPPHMQPGAAPLAKHQQLPNHLPRPGSEPVATETVQVVAPPQSQTPPPRHGGVPRVMTHNGGRSGQAPAPAEQAPPPVALNPYGQQQSDARPRPQPQPAAAARKNYSLNRGQNSVYVVEVRSARETGDLEGVGQAPGDSLYLVLEVLQRNHSFVRQSETGNFVVRTTGGERYSHLDAHSTYSNDPLPAGEKRQHRLVFLLPKKERVLRLELEGVLPLQVDL